MIAAYIAACLLCFAAGIYVGIHWCLQNLISLEEKGVVTIDIERWERSVR